MAENPYSKYTGTRISPVPAGYLTAAGQMAENTRAGLAGLGKSIGAGIAKYYEDKEEEKQKEATLGAHLLGQNLWDKEAGEGGSSIPSLPGTGQSGSPTKQNVTGDELREWVERTKFIGRVLEGEKQVPGIPPLPGVDSTPAPTPSADLDVNSMKIREAEGYLDEINKELKIPDPNDSSKIERMLLQKEQIEQFLREKEFAPTRSQIPGKLTRPLDPLGDAFAPLQTGHDGILPYAPIPGEMPGKLTEPLPMRPGLPQPGQMPGKPTEPMQARDQVSQKGARGRRRNVQQNMNDWIEKYGETANRETIQNAYEIIKGYSDSDTARKANRLRRKTLKQGLEKGGLDIQKLQGELDQMKDGEVKTMSIPGAPNYLFAKPPGQKGWIVVQVPKAAIPVTQAQADAANKKMANHVDEDGKKKPIEYHWIPDINNPGKFLPKSIKKGADPTALFRLLMGDELDAPESTPDKKEKKNGVIQWRDSLLNPNFDPNKK